MKSLATKYGRKIVYDELGDGPPLLYLHDFIDIHAATTEWLPFHRRLAERFRLIAPAHAGCNGSDEDIEASGPEDAVFHVLELLDALEVESLPVLGVGVGGWIAAELAVRERRLVERLVLVGATGLYVPDEPTADIFFEVQPRNGTDMSPLRAILFAPDAAAAREWIPDGRLPVAQELLRYEMFRFTGRIGFKPPYLYDRQLSRRLARYDRPALVIAGERDGLVSAAHARAYAEGLPNARLNLVRNAGHSVHVEQPDAVAADVLAFLAPAPAEVST